MRGIGVSFLTLGVIGSFSAGSWWFCGCSDDGSVEFTTFFVREEIVVLRFGGGKGHVETDSGSLIFHFSTNSLLLLFLTIIVRLGLGSVLAAS